MNETLLKLINEQITGELYSSYLYLAMAARCEVLGLSGFADYFTAQSGEENAHALKIMRFLTGKNIYPKFADIKSGFDFQTSTIDNMAETYYVNEVIVTRFLCNICEIATENKDFIVTAFFGDFIKEQISGEREALELFTKVQSYKNDILLIDSKLGDK